jgi:predicted nuclease of restriction endonuclease-like (RecB) superfamily
MRSLAEAWPHAEIVPQLVALLPWGHLRVLLDQLKDREEREWYLRAAVEYGWSRNALVLQIKSGLREREGKAITNFQRALPPPDSDLAEQVLKDPYNFDFLMVTREAHEREIEHGLLIHLRDLLIELGRGFAFVGPKLTEQTLLKETDLQRCIESLQPIISDLLIENERLRQHSGEAHPFPTGSGAATLREGDFASIDLEAN